MNGLDKEEVESSKWLFYSTDGRARESKARLQAGLPETQDCSHSLGNTYWVEIVGGLLTVPSKCLQCGRVWRHGDGGKTSHLKRSESQTEGLLISHIFPVHFK